MGNRTEDDHIIRLAAEVGAREALKAFDKKVADMKSEKVDRRLRNTKLLLRHYRTFRDHAANAVYDAQALVDSNPYDIIDLMSNRLNDNEDVFVDSIKKSVERTVTIVRHIDVMLQLYEAYCMNSGIPEEVRRWNVIKARFIDEKPVSVHKLAADYHVDERTIFRDIENGCERLAALIFGIDGVRKEN